MGTAFVKPPPHSETPRDGIRPVRLVVVGDSTAKSVGLALASWGASSGDAEVWVVSSRAGAVLQGTHLALRCGWELPPDAPDLVELAFEAATVVDADALVVSAGSANIGLWRDPSLDQLVGVHQPGVADQYRAALVDAVARLGTLRIPLLWADVPPLEWAPDHWEERSGATAMGHGESTLNDIDRWRIVDRIDTEVLGAAPIVARWPITETLIGPDGRVPDHIRPDGAHLALDPAVALAETKWAVALKNGYRSVLAAGAATSGPHRWHTP